MYNAYAWTGSQSRQPEAEKGNQMFQEIRNDMDHRHGTAQLLVGDLNASINKHNVLQSMITKDGWTDLGAVASRWGGQDEQNNLQSKQESQSNTDRSRTRFA